MNKEELNPFEYQYKPNDVIELPGNALLNIMYFLEKVIADQPRHFVPYSYASDVKIRKDKDDNIVSVQTDWQPYPSIETFLQTIENPVVGATEITILAEQIFYKMSLIHQENIEKGIASKPAEFEPLNNKKDEPSVLDNTDKK